MAQFESEVVPQLVESKDVPLTLITGFLGSGKSTLVRSCMSQLADRGIRVAYIQNEFSGVEESPIVKSSDGEIFSDFMELANGCVCCTVKTDFVLAIEELLKRRKFDHIFVECSGDADPSPVIALFWVDEELDLGVYLDSVICVVDSKNFKKNLNAVQGVRF